jgi:hypothetical protein
LFLAKLEPPELLEPLLLLVGLPLPLLEQAARPRPMTATAATLATCAWYLRDIRSS